jgi:opacity protein-like surface antigen
MMRIMNRPDHGFPSLHTRGLALLAAGALVSLADTALAETTASFYVGSSRTGNSDVRISQPGTGSDATFRSVNWDSEPFKAPFYYGIRVTHFLDDRPEWGVGFDFTHDKVYARTSEVVHVDGTWNGTPVNEDAPMNQRVQSFGISHGVNILGLNVYRRWMHQTSGAFPRGRWQPYAGAGLTCYVLHPENTVNGQHNSEGFEGGGFGYQLLGGLQYGVTQTAGMFIEAKYNSGKVKVGTAGGGRGETELKSSQLLAGVSVAF